MRSERKEKAGETRTEREGGEEQLLLLSGSDFNPVSWVVTLLFTPVSHIGSHEIHTDTKKVFMFTYKSQTHNCALFNRKLRKLG